ncbi:MAG: M3 family oligoendopeptidase [Clostridia bacterium]|nr:M3 family oligoendopeptidase [Clostridia bacterium]
MKVREIPYERYDIENLKKALAVFEDSARNAENADEVLSSREIFRGELMKYSTASSLANCRFTLNTKDKFYNDEVDYYDNVSPIASEVMVKYGEVMLSSPFRGEIEKRINPIFYKNYETAKKAYNPSVEKECQTENAIVTEYSRFMSELGVEWQGKTLPLSVVRGYLEDENRDTRKEAACAIGKALEKNSATLDDIYDRLVKIRTAIARKLGYKNFVELGYYRMNRIDYDREMVENFRKNVLADLVPVVCELKRGVAKDLGIDEMKYYDDAVYIKGGNPRPKDDAKGIFENAQKMYDEMNPEIGDFMRSMRENEAFDVEARDGKWGGGYCTGFALYKQPFILANFNGTAGDIDVITHEFGHAFAAKKSFDEGDFELDVGGMETAECHSMSMEFFCEKYMDKFFDKPKDYCKSHLLSSICFIPYGVIVDEFQHIIYENPDLSPDERKKVYLDLEKKYRPYMNFDGIPYLEKGTRWQYQMHIYESPFYYIDYCLAQTVSLGFLVLMTENYDEALKRYITFVRAGGTKLFSELVKEAGVPYPFGEGTLKTLAEKILKIAKSYED